MFTFTVYGKPQTAGSKRGFPLRGKNGQIRVILTDANKNTKVWQAQVREEAQKVFSQPVLETALFVDMEFVVLRPKGHFNSKGTVKPNMPHAPIVRPDLLKWARAIEDACTGILWRDDSQIVTETLKKRYGQQECAIITVDIEQLPQAGLEFR